MATTARHHGGVWSACWRALSRWNAADGFILSAAMAYYAALSLLPLCLVLVAALGWAAQFAPKVQSGQLELVALVEQHAGTWLADQVEGLLAGIKTKAALGGPIGLVTLILAAAGVFVQFERILDRIWGRPQKGKGFIAAIAGMLRQRATAFAALLVIGLLLVAGLVANFVLSALRAYLAGSLSTQYAGWALPYVWWAVQLAVATCLNAGLLTIVYRVLPKAPVAWRHAAGGGVLVAVLWESGKHVFERFVIGDHFTVYGLIGSFMGVLLWIYYLSAAVFFGAAFVWALGHPNDQPE